MKLTPPITTLATRPEEESSVLPIQADASPVMSASGLRYSIVSRKSSSESSTVLMKFGTLSPVSGEETLLRYGTSDHRALASSVAPSEEEWNAASAGAPS